MASNNDETFIDEGMARLDGYNDAELIKVFQKSFSALVDGMSIHDILDTIYTEEVITRRQKETIEAQQTESEKNGKLLDFLVKRGRKNIIKFLNALKLDHQHVLEAVLIKASESASGQPAAKRRKLEAGESSKKNEQKTLNTDGLLEEVEEYYQKGNPQKSEHQRGYFLLVENYTYYKKGKEKPRTGSEVDRHGLKLFFCDTLNYECGGIKTDLTEKNIKTFIKEQCEELKKDESYKKYYCVVIAILSHGNQDGISTTDKGFISYKEIVAEFKETLVGKPKIFIFQCCQGSRIQPPQKDSSEDPTSSSVPEIDFDPKIPVDADSLVCCATTENYVSFRLRNGTWFITSLLTVFKALHQSKDIVEMMTLINRKVAEKESSDMEKGLCKQMPRFISTLRYNFML